MNKRRLAASYKITTRDELQRFYVELLPKLRYVAYELGWGLGVHGSMRRDLDLIAVPWTKKARSVNILAQRLMKTGGGMAWPATYIRTNWRVKPRGRKAIALPLVRIPEIHIMGSGIPKEKEIHGAYLDLSVKE